MNRLESIYVGGKALWAILSGASHAASLPATSCSIPSGGTRPYVTTRSVDVYVQRIREKIEPDPEKPRYLKTVHGTGYLFAAPKDSRLAG